MPLMVFLHGSGEAGSDNETQMYWHTGWGPDFFSWPDNQQRYPSYIIAPQTTEPVRWANTALDEYDLDKTPLTAATIALLDLLEIILEDYSVDKNRIYGSGISRGGQGIWNLAMLRPDYFACILPLCGSGSPRHAHKLKNTAVWAWHGNADDITRVEYSRNMINALRKVTAHPEMVRYNEIEGGDHLAGWDSAFKEPGLLDWIFSWRKDRV
ncbi:MAG TPA: phospholipase [Spirochaetota bacterium]|nr:phospholipase [Spirochaetota bacterium]